MKQLFILISLFLLTNMYVVAQEQPQQTDVDRLHSLAAKLADQKQYNEAVTLQKRLLETLRQTKPDIDSAYIDQMVYLGRYLSRNNQVDEAVDTLKSALKLYAAKYSDADYNYAIYLDNLSLYLESARRLDEAEATSRRAFEVYNNLRRQDFDFSVIAIRLAEICNENGKPQESLTYELLGLSVLKELYGEHSENYLAELPYLEKYYEAAGNQEKAERTKKRIEQLTKEREEGYFDMPKPVEFTTAEICHEHNNDVLRCCVYFLTHRLNAPHMNDVAQYIFKWSVSSADVSIDVGETIGEVTAKQGNMNYMIAYMAATSYFCLRNQVKSVDEDAYLKVFDALLEFYEQNKELSGEVDVFENFLKLKEKNKLADKLRAEYRKMKQQAKDKDFQEIKM